MDSLFISTLWQKIFFFGFSGVLGPLLSLFKVGAPHVVITHKSIQYFWAINTTKLLNTSLPNEAWWLIMFTIDEHMSLWYHPPSTFVVVKWLLQALPNVFYFKLTNIIRKKTHTLDIVYWSSSTFSCVAFVVSCLVCFRHA